MEVELESQQAKRYSEVVMDDAEGLAKKLKQVGEWLKSMHKQMIETRQREV